MSVYEHFNLCAAQLDSDRNTFKFCAVDLPPFAFYSFFESTEMSFSSILIIFTFGISFPGFEAWPEDEGLQVSKRVYGGREVTRPYYVSLKSTFCQRIENGFCIGMDKFSCQTKSVVIWTKLV